MLGRREAMLLIELSVKSFYILYKSCQILMVVTCDPIFLGEFFRIIEDLALGAVFVLVLMGHRQVLNDLAHSRR